MTRKLHTPPTPWMLGAQGETIDLLHPDRTPIHLSTIARSLGHLSRWTGHTSQPYTVAAHSLHVAYQLRELPTVGVLAALMHDAHEAYVGDVPTPLKLCMGERYRVLDRAWMTHVRRTFGVLSASAVYANEIAEADARALATEWAQLMPTDPPPHLPAPDKTWDCQQYVAGDLVGAFFARADALMGKP